MIRLKVFQTRKLFAPWLSDTTKHLIKDRDMVQVQASSSRDQNDWENYKVLQSKATKTKKIQEQNE